MTMMNFLKVAEIEIAGFLLPWGLIMGTLGFLIAWGVVVLLERASWTRHIWHLPLFFIALVIFFASVLGLFFSP